MKYNIKRFIKAQEEDYKTALLEIKNGNKKNHWMWYIFPQLQDLGSSLTSKYYGIKDYDEAVCYLENEYLKNNLLEICDAILELNVDSIEDVLEFPDYLKLKSCMTLFNYVDPNEERFIKVLDKYFDGKKDDKTIKILEKK